MSVVARPASSRHAFLDLERLPVRGERRAVLGERIADGSDANQCRGDAGLILAPAFDRQPLFVGVQRARQVALKVQRVGQVLQRFALVALVANPTGDLAHPFESHLRLRVLLFLGRLTGAPRQRQDQFQRHEVGLGLEQRLPFLHRRRGDETVRQRIDGRALAHELPVTVLANVNEAPRRRRSGR